MTITYRGSTIGFSTGTVTSWSVIPGLVTGDLILLLWGGKPYDTTCPVPTGYTSITHLTSGTTATGTDVGSTAADAWYKSAVTPENAPTAVHTQSTTPSMNPMIALTKSTGAAWTITHTTAIQITASASLSVTGADALSWAVGDWVVVQVVHRSDAATHTSPSIAASGITFGSLTQRLSTTTTINGNDGAIYVYTAAVTAGSGSGPPTFTATVGGTNNAQDTSVIFMRVREGAGATADAQAWNGTAWRTFTVWNGTSWVHGSVWNGTAWKTF